MLIWAEKCLQDEAFPRADYRELLELTIVYLGGEVDRFHFQKPGACHHARFMSQAIYLLKIELLSNLFQMSPEDRRAVHRMANFISLFYAKLFLRSRIAVFAPTDDFHFLSAMEWYKEEDFQIATAVTASVKRHLWYLTEELVILALFNESLSHFTRSRLAQTLFNTPRPTSFAIGKPNFARIAENMPTFLHDFADLSSEETWGTLMAPILLICSVGMAVWSSSCIVLHARRSAARALVRASRQMASFKTMSTVKSARIVTAS